MRTRRTFIALVGLVLAAAAGCAPMYDTPHSRQNGAPGEQKYNLGFVRTQLPKLRPGMAKVRVVILLGAPVKMDGDIWTYADSGWGLPVPVQAVRVRFQNGAYAAHSETVVFGQ